MSDASRDRSLRELVGEKAVMALHYARARVQLHGAHLGGRVYSGGRLVVSGHSGITLGARNYFIGGMVGSELHCHPDAEIVVGDDTGFNYGASIVAKRSIRIGARCLFGAMVRVSDHDGARVAPIHIGDDVWIAHCAIIEPGVVIGDGAVVAAGSVVRTSVSAGMMAIGNPARSVPLELSSREAMPIGRAENR